MEPVLQPKRPAREYSAEDSSTTIPRIMKSLKLEEAERLVQAAVSARDQAYAPHSHFYVGAAILTVDGSIAIGCNVENSSYGLTICAERNAAAAAIASGNRQWRGIAIASVGGVSPCGACRQFLAEFGLNLNIICIDVITGGQKTYWLAKLLPDAFTAEDL